MKDSAVQWAILWMAIWFLRHGDIFVVDGSRGFGFNRSVATATVEYAEIPASRRWKLPYRTRTKDDGPFHKPILRPVSDRKWRV